MKIKLLRLWTALLAGAMIIGAAAKTQAQTILGSYTNNFDSSANAASWNFWYDLPQSSGSPLMGWDGAVDNTPSHPGSGSLPYFINWPGTSGAGQMQIYGTFAENGQYNLGQSIDATKYDSVSFDLRADPSCPTNSNGDICVLNVGLFHTYSIYSITNINIPTSATNGWIHYVCPINKATAPGVSDLTQGVGFNVNLYGGGNPNLILNAQSTPTKMWIDNIQVNVSQVENPPPTLQKTITTPIPGLNLFSSDDGSGAPEFNRTSIRRINQTGLSFQGQNDVTYSFTIKNFPNPLVYTNYQAHIFLATPDGASSIDYNTPNLIWLNVQGTADGGATAYFRYKIFEPNANSNIFGVEYTSGPLGTPWAGQLTNVTATTAIGTWSMTFNQDTNVTISGPGGVSTTFTIRPEVAAQFTEPLALVYGAQANRQSNTDPGLYKANLGQDVVLASVDATNSGGAVSIVSDDFLADTTLNTSIWSISAGAPNTVQLFPNDPGQKLVKWTQPDTGFFSQVASNLTGPWYDLSAVTTFSASGLRVAVVPSSSLSSSQNYFRMIKRRFVKLQVLLPGETAAPGTPTGKTGTPTAQQIGVPFDVVVNAVDTDWHVITTAGIADQITLSSPDPGFSWPNSFSVNMVNGTVTFDTVNLPVSFGTSGSWTLTATDATDGSKTANTSPPVTVP